MLCRKKLVLFLTLTTLGLMYISANHYLSNADKNSSESSKTVTRENSVEMLVKATPMQSVMSKKTQLEKYLQPLSSENVEFRTANPIPSAKKIGKMSNNF